MRSMARGGEGGLKNESIGDGVGEGGGVGEGDGVGDSSLHQQRPFWVLGGATGTASWKPKSLKSHLKIVSPLLQQMCWPAYCLHGNKVSFLK